MLKNKTFLFILFAGALAIFQSCKSDELADSSSELPLDKSRMEIIADISQEYENAILDVLSQRNQLRSNGVPTGSFDFGGRVNERFSQRAAVYAEATPSPFLRTVGEDFVLDAGKLQDRLDILQSLWFALPSMQDSDDNDPAQEDVLSDMQKVSDNFVLSVLNDNSLSEIEKQLIAENIVFRTNLAIITIKYGEEIEDVASTRIFKWIKKNLAKIRCTALSVAAAASCTTAIVSTATGPAAVALWATCVAATANATNCWASI